MSISRILYYKTPKQFLGGVVFLNSLILAICKMNHRNTVFIRARFTILKHQEQPKYPKLVKLIMCPHGLPYNIKNTTEMYP